MDLRSCIIRDGYLQMRAWIKRSWENAVVRIICRLCADTVTSDCVGWWSVLDWRVAHRVPTVRDTHVQATRDCSESREKTETRPANATARSSSLPRENIQFSPALCNACIRISRKWPSLS
jgi:hypothetical protein